MRYSLKFIVPAVVLILGVTDMGMNIFFYSKSEHAKRVELTKERISIVGNRIANEIEHKQLYGEKSFAELRRIFSQYTLEYLNKAEIYNEDALMIFNSTPAKFSSNNYSNNKSISQVIKDKKLYIYHHREEMRIDAIFPLAMPLKDNEVYSKNYGALYLEFDMSVQHQQLEDSIYKYAIVNGFVILLMVMVLAFLMYFLILRRLSILHKMTIALSMGNYDVRVESGFNDELGKVNNAFNNMAQQIAKHQKELESRVEEAVKKNKQQNHLMMQQNRLVAMGEMINNIAHQWRQPLNTLALILQKLELFHKRGKLSSDSLEENVAKGMFQIETMSTTIDDFRDFFKQDKEMQTFCMKELIEESSKLMQSTLEENRIQISSNIEPSTQISAYKNELIQVIINLINNAKDALVENVESDRWIDIGCYVEDEKMVMEIRDNAGGVPEDVIDKIFDPYFSTKEEGKGTGIGLYMSKTIIEENMKGMLEVENSDEGAVFKVILYLDNLHPFCIVNKSDIHCKG